MTQQATSGERARKPAIGMTPWLVLTCMVLGMLGFFLPFSSAGVSVSMAGLLLLALARPRTILASQPWKEPTMAVGLALLAYIAMHTLWTTGANAAAAEAVNHYQELLLAPLVFALMRDATCRRVFLRAFFLGATLLAIAYWGALVVPSLSNALSSRRISTGFALAVCAFLVLAQAQSRPRRWPGRVLGAFLAATVLFAVDARTGHVVLVVLVACAAWWYSPRRWRWAAAFAAPLLVLVLAMASGAVNSRLKETLAGSQPASGAGPLTSTAIRVNMLHVATDLARRYALTGAGFANYSAVNEQAALARYGSEPAVINDPSHWVRTGNPHNEFLMQLIGGGVASLGLFLLWLGLPLREAARARAPVAAMTAGTVIAFGTACLFNSLLLDFVEGHLYMALLAWLLAEHRFAPAEDAQTAGVHRVLVIATRQIGDVLLTTPLIRTARERWPDARIEVLVFEGTVGMLRGNPDIDALIEVPTRLGAAAGGRLMGRLWRSYDLALVADAGDRAHLLGWFAAPRRSGIIPAANASNWWKRLLLDHVVVAAGDLGSVHVAPEKQLLLEPWLRGRDKVRPQVIVPPPAPLPADVQALLVSGYLVVHAPSMWPYKQWPIAHFEALVRALLAPGRQVVLTGSSSERDQECIAPLRRLAQPPRLLDLSGRLDFNQLATLLGKAALYIGPDTSVSHLAAASGVPVIAILGPTNPMRWAPWPAGAEARALFARSAGVQHVANVTVMQGGLACVPCGRAGCEDHRQSRSDCLVDITPEQVLEQALEILAGRR
jgi:ADP-heptose:LPS heptosyltransferase/O-antigen ligase